MGKVKVKKSDTFIDMTPMSDVMTLLLTFFMLTSTFVKNEPVKVNTPGSVSETKVPENGVLTILVSPEKRTYRKAYWRRPGVYELRQYQRVGTNRR